MNRLADRNLLQGIMNGAQQVLNHKEELNRINVFPVADGDTGSNLASLMQAIIDQVSFTNVSQTEGFNQLTQAALIGSRGNSGMIFAQYFHGLSVELKLQEINEQVFLTACKEAANKAYESVLDPKEGTILSVMRVWADRLETYFVDNRPFEEILKRAQKDAEQAVKETQFQMTVLKKNKLVDAGAKGFYYFIEGLTAFLCGEETKTPVVTSSIMNQQPLQEGHDATLAPHYRYCSEFLIKHVRVTLEELKQAIAREGDSLVLVGDRSQVKLHVHTNNPDKLMLYFVSVGEVSYQKVDDMRLQYEVMHARRADIAIVTDSIADMPSEYLLAHQVYVLPMNITIGNQTYLDKLTVDAAFLEQSMSEGVTMSTAQPSIHIVDGLLSFLADTYKHVLVITVAEPLSGTFQLLKQRIKEKNFSSEWIQVLDSKQNSVAQGLLISEAVQMVEKGIGFQTIVEQLNDLRAQLFIYVAVDDLQPMIRSGRIPAFLGKIAMRIGLRPIVTLDATGNGKLSGVSFSRKQSIKQITNKMRRLAKKQALETVMLTHVFDAASARKWAQKLSSYGLSVTGVVDSSAAIAISAGKSSLAVAGIKKEEQR